MWSSSISIKSFKVIKSGSRDLLRFFLRASIEDIKINCEAKKNVSPKTIKMCNVTERTLYDKLRVQLMFKAAAIW